MLEKAKMWCMFGYKIFGYVGKVSLSLIGSKKVISDYSSYKNLGLIRGSP